MCYLFIYEGHSSGVNLINIHKISRHSIMTSQAIHPGLKTSSSGSSLSEGETFISKISKVPAVGQMISESHFFRARRKLL